MTLLGNPWPRRWSSRLVQPVPEAHAWRLYLASILAATAVRGPKECRWLSSELCGPVRRPRHRPHPPAPSPVTRALCRFCLSFSSAPRPSLCQGSLGQAPRSVALPRDVAFLCKPWCPEGVARSPSSACCGAPRALRPPPGIVGSRSQRSASPIGRSCPAGCGRDRCVEENPGHLGSWAQCLCPSLTFKEGNCSFQQTTLRSVAPLAQFSDGRQTEAALETEPQPGRAWPALCPQSRVPAAKEAAGQSSRPCVPLTLAKPTG